MYIKVKIGNTDYIKEERIDIMENEENVITMHIEGDSSLCECNVKGMDNLYHLVATLFECLLNTEEEKEDQEKIIFLVLMALNDASEKYENDFKEILISLLSL